jgi:uncharacterized SAM-dependent methyltransferase
VVGATSRLLSWYIANECAGAYDSCFEAALARTEAKQLVVVGLGCGAGQKDARLMQILRNAGKNCVYEPVDVSTAMVLVAEKPL